MAGLVGFLYFYRQEVGLALEQPVDQRFFGGSIGEPNNARIQFKNLETKFAKVLFVSLISLN
jgi:hypothetical protein